MVIKKAGGKIFGAELTASEKKAMDIEIKRQLAEYDRKNTHEIDAIVLWVLHTQLGFGEKRHKKFYDAFAPALEALADRYELDSSNNSWLCTTKLKEKGIDIEKWY